MTCWFGRRALREAGWVIFTLPRSESEALAWTRHLFISCLTFEPLQFHKVLLLHAVFSSFFLLKETFAAFCSTECDNPVHFVKVPLLYGHKEMLSCYALLSITAHTGHVTLCLEAFSSQIDVLKDSFDNCWIVQVCIVWKVNVTKNKLQTRWMAGGNARVAGL